MSSDADARCNLGETFQAQGRWHDAFRCFQEAVQLDPSHADARNNLGMLLVMNGRLAEALSCFQQALRINPNDANALYNLGITLKAQGRPAEALACFQQTLRLNPSHAFAHFNLGLAFMEQGQPADAAFCYRQALHVHPGLADAHHHLGNALFVQGQLAEAADCYRQALQLNPDLADAHYNLGNALEELGQPADAIRCYRQALRLTPARADIHNNLGNALAVLGQLSEASAHFRQTLRIDPNYIDAYTHLGNAYVADGKFDDAAECYRQALTLDPEHSLTLWNRTHLRLLQGDFQGGWPGYEQRWSRPKIVPRSFSQPRWNGAPLEGKIILVYAEQGLGDTLQFARYLPLVQQRGGTVIFECQPVLAGLLTSVTGVSQVVPAGQPLSPYDVQIPLLSLPGLFGTTLATIPADVPYLAVDPQRIQHWRQQLTPGVTGLLNVGIVWQGSMNQKGDRRSVPLTCFESLGHLPGVRLVSLQVGPAAQQLAAARFPITDVGSRFDTHSLEDLAAVLLNLDLVITVDTAVAHLAGALGVPVWVVLAFSSCWRWLLDRSDSPWYPTMRLFRQSTRRDWSEVFEGVTRELKRWADVR